MSTIFQPQTRDEAIELAEIVSSEIDAAIQHDRTKTQDPSEFLTVRADSLAGQTARRLDELTTDFFVQVTFLKATQLMRKYRMELAVSDGSYTGDVKLELRGTGIEG